MGIANARNEISYDVKSFVVQLGDTPNTGHYSSFPFQCVERWVNTDDGRPGKLATPTSLQLAWRDVYLICCSRRSTEPLRDG